ncbi:MAG: hypothetical protein DGJ47_000717 [Rickettsiaceae bacterium]
MRIAKFIAHCGVCSRRKAEELIEQKRVSVNGEIISSPALNVSENDEVKVDGARLKSTGKQRLWLYYKPAGLVTTHSDPQNRLTVFSQLPKSMPRVVSVGRLDLNSEGLLLLTNSGDLVREFENPRNEIERVYKVRVFGPKKPLDIDNKELKIDGVSYRPVSIKQASVSTSQAPRCNAWYEVILKEGKNREIRKIFQHYGYEVSRLIRVSFGQYSLGALKRGQVKEVVIEQ